MAIQWQEASQTTSPSIRSSSGNNPWMAATIGLLGIIVGFGIGTWNGGGSAFGGAAQQVAQAPSAPTPSVPTPTPQPPAPSAPVPPVDAKTDHIRGDLSKATVAVIEYSDFECPFSKRNHPTMQQITQDYGNKVAFVYRHFPLGFHANAEKEAEASECANDQGKFWQYHDAIFERTTSNGTGFALDKLVPLAKELGLNEAKFKNCLDTGKYTKHVQEQQTAGGAAGVNGTPGNFVLNLKTQKSQALSGAQPFSAFKSAIDAAF